MRTLKKTLGISALLTTSLLTARPQIISQSLRFVRTMSQSTFQSHGVPVSLPDGLSENQVTTFKPFNVSLISIAPFSETNYRRTGSAH